MEEVAKLQATGFAPLNQHPALKTDPNDFERDSGYGSASRQATTTVPSISDLRDNSEVVESLEKDEVGNYMQMQLDDDIRSVVSEGDDIRSQRSDATTNEGITGKALIRAFLAEQPAFKGLCEKALGKMSKQRFVQNMSRLLRSFHVWLAEEAESEAQKAIAELLRSKRGRRRISEQLATHIDLGREEEEEEEAQDSGKIELEIPLERRQGVENWLRSQAAGKPPRVEDFEPTSGQDQDSDTIETDLEDASEPDIFPYISELKAFLLASKAFRNLQMRFMLMFLPADVEYVLQSIPKESIWLSQEQDASISNRFKILVENTTKVRWNWWPLSQKKRMLYPGEVRLFWHCVSTTNLHVTDED